MTTIGRYHVESELGRGAMGVVYLAIDDQLQRRVALKVYTFPDGLPQDRRAEFRDRFAREARAAAGLTHDGIVTVYDAGEDPDSGVPFIAMEHVEGRTLRDELQGCAPLPVARAVEIATALADALEAAHTAGIVHRDVKPANVLIRDGDGAIKIADFGVARVADSTLTRSGATIGSPAYMSPEQIQGQDVDARSDLFSLAVILYEMLTGARPFSGDDPHALAFAVVRETPVPPSRRRPELPRAFDDFFDTALAKEPGSRFADAASFRRGLIDAVTGADRPAESTRVATTVVLAKPSANALADRLRANPLVERFGARRVGFALAAVVLLLALALLWPERDSVVKIDARNGFTEGRLTLLVDGDEVFSRELSAPKGKRGFVKKVLATDLESFEAIVEIEPGRREIEARVDTGDGEAPLRESIVADLEPGESRTLKLTAGRAFRSPLSVKLQ